MYVCDIVLFFRVFEKFYLKSIKTKQKKHKTLTCVLHFIHFQGILPTETMS